MDQFLKLKISLQIRVGIISVVLFAIIISLALLTVSTLIQYNTMINYYEEIIEDEDNKMLLNFEQYVHTVEKLLDRKSKLDLAFYTHLENIFYESLEGLELKTLLNINFEVDKIFDINKNPEKMDICFTNSDLNCIVYKFYPEENDAFKEEDEFKLLLNYYNLIFPILNTSLQEKCVGTYILKQYNNLQFYKIFYNKETNEPIGKVIFYVGTNITLFDPDYNENQYNNNVINNILDHLLDLFYLIPTFNKKISLLYILQHFNDNFTLIPLITSKYLFEGETDNPYKRNKNQKSKINIYENNLSFESKILGFNPISPIVINSILNLISTSNPQILEIFEQATQFLYSQINSMEIFKWSDNIFENLIFVLFEKFKTSLNLLPVIHSLFPIIKNEIFKNNPYFDKIRDENFITKLIINQFSCIYIVQQELSKTEISLEKLHSFNITQCDITFNDDFNNYIKNGPTQIDIYDRRKIKVEILKYDIKYIYFNLTNEGEYIDEEYSLYYNKKNEKNKKLSKFSKSYKIYQGMYPTDTLNSFTNVFLNNLVTVNFYFSNLFSSYYDIDNIQKICNVFFKEVLYPSLILWAIVLLIIMIIVFKISDSISDPIDKLIQSVSMNNKSSKELNKYLKNISYKDDSTINDLFVLCKKLIIGGFKREGDEDIQQKKKIKSINAYNNISLVKTNNMIINESEIMKGEKKQEINYFEKSSLDKSKQFLNLNSHSSSESSEKKFNYRVLSGPLFTGKFYQYNKGYLIKDKEYFDILTNEVMARKKKINDENKSKNNKNNRHHTNNNNKDQ